jgi:hypothetical protein
MYYLVALRGLKNSWELGEGRDTQRHHVISAESW